MLRTMWSVTVLAVFFLLAASACQVSPGSDATRLIKYKVPTCS